MDTRGSTGSALLGLAICALLTTTSFAATVSLAWMMDANIIATVNSGDNIVWQWGDAFPHTLQQVGNQTVQLFTGPGTGACSPGNTQIAPFRYTIQTNQSGRFTYNDACNPLTTLGILVVLPPPPPGVLAPPVAVTTQNTTNSPPVFNSSTLVLSPPPPPPIAPAPAPLPRLVLNATTLPTLIVGNGGFNGTAKAPLSAPLVAHPSPDGTGVLITTRQAVSGARSLNVPTLDKMLVTIGVLVAMLALLN